jgi:hypothetical protein
MFAKLRRLWRPNRRVFLWRDCQSDYRATALTSPPLARKPHVSVHEEITTPQYILKKIRWKYCVPQSSTEPGDASALLSPLATPIPPMSPLKYYVVNMWFIYGAKLLLRKVPQYMGHSAVCQVGCLIFFVELDSGLNLRTGPAS